MISRVLLLDADREISCEIQADVHTLEIRDVRMEVLKAPGENADEIPLGFLIGEKTFIEGKRVIRTHLTDPADRLSSYLLQQSINGIIQAETYFWHDRGFPDAESYNRYWDDLEQSGCRMYSHPDPADLRWLDYAPPGPRRHALFHRLKSVQILESGGQCAASCAAQTDAGQEGQSPAEEGGESSVTMNGFVCRGDFIDSYHEISIQLICDSQGIIREAQIQFLRAPGKACFENEGHAFTLPGHSIYDLKSADIIELIGGEDGCYHLVEILKDMRTLSIMFSKKTTAAIL